MPQPLSDTSYERDLALCRATLRGGSKSFFAASLVLPGTIMRRASAIYAFCRLADDLIDNGGGMDAVASLSRRLDAIYANQPYPDPADRALAAILRDVHLPRAAFEALIEGFAWDCEGRRYETLADLQDYAARVAGSVGILMSVAMNRQSPDVLARAADLGVAMQLTNIARDIGEDARIGRLYLPMTWLREAGIDPESFLARPVATPALKAIVRRLLDEADRLYARADAGLAQLPMSCRFGIRVARRLYAAIGTEVIRSNANFVSSRAVVPAHAKLAAVVSPGAIRRKDLAAPPLPATAFLVHAAENRSMPSRDPAPAWWDLRGRSLQVLDIFERLERAERTRA